MNRQDQLLDGFYRRDTYSPRVQDMYPRDQPSAFAGVDPVAHTQSPIVTGTSVIALKFQGGVMMAADTLASYGSLARFRDVERLHKLTDTAVLGSTGDVSDYQHVQHMMERLMIREDYHNDGHKLAPPHLFEYLRNVMYHRRSKNDPLWNRFVLAGHHNNTSFLGYVDLQGTTYQSDTIATGFGAHLAQPLLRKAVESRGGPQNVTEEDAIKIIEDCMRVLFYRDARSLNKFQRATIATDRLEITEPYSVDTEWAFAESIRGYGV
ncbi:proteasome endopeptidase complex, beta subunit [Thamnocephalis sphaerospora]|uniref:Proteasome subunit beta n=1 Tax=Thamnocephalis sphaerospora TaxID=78915 RepID=A0A4P9XQQ4_9FUNG|nr:proteasome endopeptidase complex, beta subunit [Thamnocephalis sphaerospora]|eukprot:RKP08375.1 proteasome endopeptidase complex, beta subunit [Thamnocephalis sphaerospora]